MCLKQKLVFQVFLRVVGPLEKLLDSSRCSDLGLFLRGFVLVRGLTKPCSSISACCFLCKYSCLMSSRRAFSSSFRTRSSSALRLEQTWQGLRHAVQHTRTHAPQIHLHPYLCVRSNLPGLVTFELTLYFLLLFAKSRLFRFALLLEEEGSTTFGHFILCFLVILQFKTDAVHISASFKHIHGEKP